MWAWLRDTGGLDGYKCLNCASAERTNLLLLIQTRNQAALQNSNLFLDFISKFSIFIKSQLWDTVRMNQFEERERLKMDRKLLKPQVERRRRERMNRSLENLRLLLLQEPEQQAVSQRRVEKAEILEHTVLFLQSSVTETKRLGAVDESEGRQFQDGFSVCLQKAACFLQERSETRSLHRSLTSTLHRRLSRCHPLPHTGRDVTHGPQSARRHTHILTHPHTDLNTVHHHHHHTTTTTTTSSAPPSTTSPRTAAGQSVWRPWP